MTVTITPTNIITEIDGVQVRLWRGLTGKGNRIVLAVHRVMAEEHSGADLECRTDLIETVAPAEDRILPLRTALDQAYDLRMLY
jgi:hypothetical protein